MLSPVILASLFIILFLDILKVISDLLKGTDKHTEHVKILEKRQCESIQIFIIHVKCTEDSYSMNYYIKVVYDVKFLDLGIGYGPFD